MPVTSKNPEFQGRPRMDKLLNHWLNSHNRPVLSYKASAVLSIAKDLLQEFKSQLSMGQAEVGISSILEIINHNIRVYIRLHIDCALIYAPANESQHLLFSNLFWLPVSKLHPEYRSANPVELIVKHKGLLVYLVLELPFFQIKTVILIS